MELSDLLWGNWPEGQVEAGADTSAASFEEMLIARCLDGEDVAYDALYQRYAPYIYRLVYALLQHRQDAEEVLQDSFEYAFRRLDRYDAARASFKTWLYQIAVSRSRNKRRRKWVPTISLAQASGDELADRARPQPEERLALTQQQRAVWEALQALSPRLRETAILRYYEGLTFVEIGQILDIPAKTAQSRMRLAHNKLRALLDEEQL
ncbi:MAG: sigma-70 family RNA polymerase sigma factor [Anaerolineae bacterium]|nr:sigma-70 family RNA polymerase sigma factor [Anaerolineae bacterium]